MSKFRPYDMGLEIQVALFYLSAAVEYLEDSQEFELPKSRRLSSQWSTQLRDVRRGAAAGRAPDADGDSSAAPNVPEVVSATTDLLVSAFQQSCSKIRVKGGSSDAVLDCVIALALKRAHETCTIVRERLPSPAAVASHAATLPGDRH